MMKQYSTARLLALVRKETFQVLRDPSALLIAFVLPVILLFLFSYAVSLDVSRVSFAVILEGEGPAANDLAAAYTSSAWLDSQLLRDRRDADPQLVAGQIRGYVVIPADFEKRLFSGTGKPAIQIISDGSLPSIANATTGYAQGIYQHWLSSHLQAIGSGTGTLLGTEPRFWFNPELESRKFLLPGAMAIIMTMIGTLLTALVVAREWERGTMEAMLSTPARALEIFLSKLVPYFVLGIVATSACTMICTQLFDLPLRGSWFALLLLSSAFMMPALGQGLLISAIAGNQFIASQIALLSAFLPAFLLSGFLFEIASMPAPIRWLTCIVSARWFVEGLTTVFLAGDIWTLLLKDIVLLLLIGVVFIAIAIRRTSGTLDT